MITSTSSSQVKHVISLLSKARERKKNKEYVVEGVRMVSEVPADLLVKIYMSERFHGNNPEYVHELVKKQGISSDSIEIVADNVFDRMSQTQTPQGIMAVVRMNDSSISDMLTDNPLLILVENLQDPGNLGTILRMGEGAGVTGVVMSSNTVDIYNPKTIRSTMVLYSECHLYMYRILARQFHSVRMLELRYMLHILTERIHILVKITGKEPHF